jgi:hypothetical protein
MNLLLTRMEREEGFSYSHESAILSLPTPFSTRLVQLLTSEQRGGANATGRAASGSLSPAAPAW